MDDTPAVGQGQLGGEAVERDGGFHLGVVGILENHGAGRFAVWKGLHIFLQVAGAAEYGQVHALQRLILAERLRFGGGQPLGRHGEADFDLGAFGVAGRLRLLQRIYAGAEGQRSSQQV